MEFGFGVLRLSSNSFWGMTPRELHAASAHLRPNDLQMTDRCALEHLMARYPDF